MKSKVLLFLILIFCSCLIISGQKNNPKPKGKITISGHVYDAAKKPFMNVCVIIDEKMTKAITDKDGYYEVKARPDAQVITFFTPDKGMGGTVIEGRTIIDFTITQTVTSDEAKEKYGEKAAAHQANVKNLDEDKYASYNTMSELFSSGVPGATVSGGSIKVRSAASFQQNTNPLFIVDGVQTWSVDYLRPADIKSIQVLTAAESVIYGSDGAAGVIKITTKGSSKK
jgi:TonB-dependent starch-binding outer membrane protein SusC